MARMCNLGSFVVCVMSLVRPHTASRLDTSAYFSKSADTVNVHTFMKQSS